METPTLWSGVGLFAVLGLAAVALGFFVKRLRSGRAGLSAEARAELSTLPMTPLQRRAWWGLLAGLAMAGATVAVIAKAGPVAYFESGDLQHLVLLFIFGALASFLFVVVPAGLQAVARNGKLDERDQRILSIAPQVQSAACLITVAGWGVALTEMYRGLAGIPTGFMYLIFWSVFFAYMLAFPAGILIGYWLARHDAQG